MNEAMYNQLLNEKFEFQKDYLAKSNGYNRCSQHTGTINTKDYENGFYITTDPKKNSLLKPIFVDIPDVDTFKKFGGNANEMFDYSLIEDHHEELPEWNEEKTKVDYQNLSHIEHFQLIKAMKKYVHGNSNNVCSYKAPLNKYFFPMKLTLFQGDDIVVSKDHPLILEGNSDQVTAYNFNSITFEKGATATTTGNVSVTANQYTSEADDGDTEIPKIFCQATSGTDAGPGGDGGSGNPGSNGTVGESNDCYCTKNATDGGPGDPGVNGTKGGDAENGSTGGEIHWTAPTMKGMFYVSNYGGDGGKGGPGGTGGIGGVGGKSAGANNHCGASKPGYGGRGGNGGPGGKGGDGGNGGIIEINYMVTSESNVTFKILTEEETRSYGKPTGRGGVGGAGGAAGAGGPGGDGNSDYNGPSGSSGATGDPGAAGTPGTIYINGRSLS